MKYCFKKPFTTRSIVFIKSVKRYVLLPPHMQRRLQSGVGAVPKCPKSAGAAPLACRRGEGGLEQPPASGSSKRRLRRNNQPLKPHGYQVWLCPQLLPTSSPSHLHKLTPLIVGEERAWPEKRGLQGRLLWSWVERGSKGEVHGCSPGAPHQDKDVHLRA